MQYERAIFNLLTRRREEHIVKESDDDDDSDSDNDDNGDSDDDVYFEEGSIYIYILPAQSFRFHLVER